MKPKRYKIYGNTNGKRHIVQEGATSPICGSKPASNYTAYSKPMSASQLSDQDIDCKRCKKKLKTLAI